MTRSWFIDEVEHAGAEHLDPDFVAGYDRKQGYPDPTAALAIFEAHGVTAGSTVVDLGAGTGQFSLPAASHFAHVIAVDISPEMVRVIRGRAADAKQAERSSGSWAR